MGSDLAKFFKQCLVATVIVFSFLASSVILVYLFPEWKNLEIYSVRLVWLGLGGGFLGGGIYMARGFYQSIIDKERSFDFGRYWWWYCFRLLLGPIAGALAIVAASLAFDLQESQQNLAAAFFLGVLSGYNFTDFINTRITKANL